MSGYNWQNKQNPKSGFMKTYSLEESVFTYSLILQQTAHPDLNPFMLVWSEWIYPNRIWKGWIAEKETGVRVHL